MRQALERLGAKGNKRPVAISHKKSLPDQRRRRFVQEGQVIVEHHQASRTAQRLASPQSDEQGEEISRLRNLLKVEQRRAEDAQRDLSDANTQLRTLETHLVHEKLHVTELKTKCAEAEQALLEAQVQLTRLREDAAVQKRVAEKEASVTEALGQKKRGPGRPPLVRKVETGADEQEPVRWWKD
ncbi:hypothetical protein ACFFGM_06555 [Asaia krungthepensis]